jgi:hypothetical protein
MVVTTYTHGWIVMRKAFRDDWFPLLCSVAPTRKEAIDRINNLGGPSPGFYQRLRRRGEMKAVPCEIEAVTRPYLNKLVYQEKS